MTNYDPGPGAGLFQLDQSLLGIGTKSGKPFDVVKGLDEANRMLAEFAAIHSQHMHNIPEPVRCSLQLLGMAVNVLALIVRARVVTEPMNDGGK